MSASAFSTPTFSEVMQDICSQVADKYILCVFIALSMYLLKLWIVPFSKLYFIETFPSHKFILEKLFKSFDEITDGLIMFSLVFYIILLWVQALDSAYKTWLYVLISMGFLTFIAKQLYLKDQRKKADLEKRLREKL